MVVEKGHSPAPQSFWEMRGLILQILSFVVQLCWLAAHNAQRVVRAQAKDLLIYQILTFQVELVVMRVVRD